MGNKLTACSACGCKIANGMKYNYGGKQYCFDCYQKLQEQLLQEDEGKKELYDYIKKLFSLSEVPEDVILGIDREIAKGKKLRGIYLTIHYYYEIEEHARKNITQILYIIRDYYEAAKQYEASVRELEKVNDKVDLTPRTRKIRLKPEDLNKKTNPPQKPKYSIEDL